MADDRNHPGVAALRKLEANLHLHWEAHKAHQADEGARPLYARLWQRLRPVWRSRILRRAVAGAGLFAMVVGVALLGLWWRLSAGPIEFDIATPWLQSAIEQNFGGNHRVEVGGTQIERDAHGGAALRLRDIVVRDADGTVVATAPKAEVGFAGASLLFGQLRAERLSLVGAGMSVRIQPDGNMTVFAGGTERPIASAASAERPRGAPTAAPPAAEEAAPVSQPEAAVDVAVAPPAASVPEKSLSEQLSALVVWLDELRASGLDGHDLTELGLKSGTLIVDDQRSGKRWTFEDIDLNLQRAKNGRMTFGVGSDSDDRAWRLIASVAPTRAGRRALSVEARNLSMKDVLLATSWGDKIDFDLPISASLRAELGSDGTLHAVQGRLGIEGGRISDPADPSVDIPIDRGEFTVSWDADRGALIMPFQISSGRDRATLVAQVAPPRTAGAPWMMELAGGSVVLAASGADQRALILNRVMLRVRFDTQQRRLSIEHGEIGSTDAGVALSGVVDLSGEDPQVALGFAGTRMKLAMVKRLWPVFLKPGVRQWVIEHFHGADVERLVIATNASLSQMSPSGPPMPDEGLSIDVKASDAVIQPLLDLPAIKKAGLTMRITGRTATIKLDNGTVTLPSGRSIAMSAGQFNVADMALKNPESVTQFRIDGGIAAVAELLATEKLRDSAGTPFDFSATKGQVSGTVALTIPVAEEIAEGTTRYKLNMDLTNFSTDHMLMNQKVEAAALHVVASNEGYQIKGDAKIGGTPATIDYRAVKGDPEAELRIATTLDEAARAKFGFDLGKTLAGPVQFKLAGKVGRNDRDSRFGVEADLTAARIEQLFPGWSKPAGTAARAGFVLSRKNQATRLDDLVIEGAGVRVKGSVEIDAAGKLAAANLPVFGLGDSDKASIKADRSGGVLKVQMRGDVFDARNFVKATMAGTADSGDAPKASDVDLDIKIGAVMGFHGEALRGVDLKLARRDGRIRAFSLNSRIGNDTALTGTLRGKQNERQLLSFGTKDAGALFRFTDTYAKMFGGELTVAMDPPRADAAPLSGVVTIRNFAIRGEPSLENAISGAPSSQRDGVQFTQMHTEFVKAPGQLTIRDGVVRGPVIGATIDGKIDYVANRVQMSGSLVPLYELNNMFVQLPIIGLFLGGDKKEGILGVTYQVVGQPSAPRLNVNPFSLVAPGILRKFFEFPQGRTDPAQSFDEPQR